MTVAYDGSVPFLREQTVMTIKVFLDLGLQRLLQQPASSFPGDAKQLFIDPIGAWRVGVKCDRLLLGHTSLFQMIWSLSEGYAPLSSFLQSTKILLPVSPPFRFYTNVNQVFPQPPG